MEITFYPIGDTGLQLSFGDVLSEELNQQIRKYAAFLRKNPINGIVEWVPAYTALTIYYQPEVITYARLKDVLTEASSQLEQFSLPPASVYEVPTVYGGEFGPDLEFVARHNGLHEKDVISLHSSSTYLIYMMGFAPGFPYLGGMPEKIAAPRLETPRRQVPAGSVGIAGSQTGVYPLETPGGWRIIGRTPLEFYNPEREKPILLEAGNYIRFKPISEQEYHVIHQAIQTGDFSIKSYPKKEGSA